MYLKHFLTEAPISMNSFNPENAANVAREVLATIQEPRRRQILHNFIAHAAAEASGRYDELMASCSRKSQSYAVYGTGQEDPTENQPQNFEELEKHYRGMIEANAYLLHFDVEKLTVGNDELWLEGVVHLLLQGHIIQAAYNNLEIDDPNAVYMLSRKTALTFIFDEDGKACGEHAYTHGPNTQKHLTKITPNQVPEQFWHNPLTGPVNRTPF